MTDLLIRQAQWEGSPRDIVIHKGIIEEILPAGKSFSGDARRTLEAQNCAVLPAFVNGHTHCPMSLLRGFADDMPLFPWLSEKIWPAEALYQEEDFYWGFRLAFLEMIKTGTAFFNDMYFQPDIALDALKDSGLRGAVNWVFLEQPGIDSQKLKKDCVKWFDRIANKGLSQFSGLAPHSVYTVSEETLRWVGDFSRERGLKIHIHLSETEKENRDCMNSHGMSPTAWLEKLGLMGPHLSVAHGLWLDDSDIQRLADHGSAVVHNPASNMKLASGPAIHFKKLNASGIPVILGTDSNSSGNNLNMMEQMKIAALLQKQHYGDPSLMTAQEIFHCATQEGARFWNTGGGIIEKGAAADLMLIRLDRPDMIPCHQLLSNLVYSVSGDAVDSLVVNGQVLMDHRKVSEEKKVLEKAAARAARLFRAFNDR